jgi:intergrase/recombinase
MLSLGIPEEVVSFIQGRIPQQILSKHYLKLSVLTDQYYPRYAVFIKEFANKVLGRI